MSLFTCYQGGEVPPSGPPAPASHLLWSSYLFRHPCWSEPEHRSLGNKSFQITSLSQSLVGDSTGPRHLAPSPLDQWFANGSESCPQWAVVPTAPPSQAMLTRCRGLRGGDHILILALGGGAPSSAAGGPGLPWGTCSLGLCGGHSRASWTTIRVDKNQRGFNHLEKQKQNTSPQVIKGLARGRARWGWGGVLQGAQGQPGSWRPFLCPGFSWPAAALCISVT